MSLQKVYDSEKPFAEALRYGVDECLLSESRLAELESELTQIVVQMAETFGSTVSRAALEHALEQAVGIIQIGSFEHAEDYQKFAVRLAQDDLTYLFRRGITALDQLVKEGRRVDDEQYKDKSDWLTFFPELIDRPRKHSKDVRSILEMYLEKKSQLHVSVQYFRLKEWIRDERGCVNILTESSEGNGGGYEGAQDPVVLAYMDELLFDEQPRKLQKHTIDQIAKKLGELRGRIAPAWRKLLEEVPEEFRSLVQDGVDAILLEYGAEQQVLLQEQLAERAVKTIHDVLALEAAGFPTEDAFSFFLERATFADLVEAVSLRKILPKEFLLSVFTRLTDYAHQIDGRTAVDLLNLAEEMSTETGAIDLLIDSLALAKDKTVLLEVESWLSDHSDSYYPDQLKFVREVLNSIT